MDETEWLAQRFEEHRSRLRAVAYRMLGSVSEADDAVQEAWLRLSRADADVIDNLGGWLTTVVARISLNTLRARRTRQEQPIGVHVPEPVIDRADGTDPEHEALLADSVGLALLVVLETLTPPERLAFVLHDMFAMPFDEIAPIVDRSPEAARQLASRARRRVQRTDPIARRRSRDPVGGRGRLPRCRPRGRLRRARRRPRPRRGAQGGSGRHGGRIARGPRRRDRRRPGAPLVTASPSRRDACSSTAPPAWSHSATGSRSRSAPSPSEAAGSSRSTSLPTRSGSAGST